MTIFIEGLKYNYKGLKEHPRRSYGASDETKFTCVSSGERYVVLYWDATVCGKKETTIVVEHGDKNWKISPECLYREVEIDYVVENDINRFVNNLDLSYSYDYDYPFSRNSKYRFSANCDTKTYKFDTKSRSHAYFTNIDDENDVAFLSAKKQSKIYVLGEEREVNLKIKIYKTENGEYTLRPLNDCKLVYNNNKTFRFLEEHNEESTKDKEKDKTI